ncbi:MAG: hypothetical protein M1822_000294 [Bathelium mastoideum]|nr:MAG: hypothetical protein M1822_000294 [Bathelium mastoideum]
MATIRDREDRITKAMKNTFEWIYHKQVPELGSSTWNSFVDWLQSVGSLYWIAGKAGSGKSTLMKFLHSEPRTRTYLTAWAQGSNLIIAGHFFWNSGDPIQMSIQGLVRTLLHSIGTALPTMLLNLFPDRWVEMESNSDLKLMVLKSWTTSECLQAFRRILYFPFSNFRFAFFIDGLDECHGEYEELVSLLKEMAASSHIKLCLASRPWSVFQDAFNNIPNLMLQYLTSRDIRFYVQTTVYEHRGFLELEKGNRELAGKLCDDITRKASGVFLWVRLAVQSLLRGIANGHRVSDLMMRLKDLPEDLEMLFRKILDSVDPAYKMHSAQLFLIHRTASECENGITLLRFPYADDDDQALFDDIERPLGRDEFLYRVKSMDRRLDSRTKGLLESSTSFIDELEARSVGRPRRVAFDFRLLFFFLTTSQPSLKPLVLEQRGSKSTIFTQNSKGLHRAAGDMETNPLSRFHGGSLVQPTCFALQGLRT